MTVPNSTDYSPPSAIRCTSKLDCGCEFCTVTRFEPTEEDALALEFIANLQPVE